MPNKIDNSSNNRQLHCSSGKAENQSQQHSFKQVTKGDFVIRESDFSPKKRKGFLHKVKKFLSFIFLSGLNAFFTYEKFQEDSEKATTKIYATERNALDYKVIREYIQDTFKISFISDKIE